MEHQYYEQTCLKSWFLFSASMYEGTQVGKPGIHFSKPSKHFRKSGLFITLFILLWSFYRPLQFFPLIYLLKMYEKKFDQTYSDLQLKCWSKSL